MQLDDIYQTLKSIEPTLSVSRFSTDYLDRSRSYLFNRRNQNKEVSTDVLLNLYQNLHSASTTFRMLKTDKHSSAHWISHFEQRAALFEDLADTVLSDLTSRTIH